MGAPKAAAGTYILILCSARARTLEVGRLGRFPLQPGYYLYVGSAFGPGGVAARCGHHMRISARPRWHIDYLRAVCRLEQIWYTHDAVRREHEWAGRLASMPGMEAPLPGFGASDCGCATHLFFCRTPPSISAFRRRVKKQETRLERVQVLDDKSQFID